MNTRPNTQQPQKAAGGPVPRCGQVRHILVERSLVRFGTGETTARRKAWETRRCGQYLWTDEHREAGRCSSCLSGWGVAHNYAEGQPQPSVCSETCPWCAGGPYAPPELLTEGKLRVDATVPYSAFHLIELSGSEISRLIDELQVHANDLRSTEERDHETLAELTGLIAKLKAARRGKAEGQYVD